MKKIASLIFMLAFTVNLINAQKISVDYDFDLETSKVMFEVLGIKSFKFQIPKEFHQKKFRIITKEYYEGEILSIDSGVILDEINEDATTLTFIGYKVSDTIEKANFYMPPNVLMNGPYQLKFERRKYDWATLINKETVIESNHEIPFLTYTYQPTFQNYPNYAVFCQLSNFVDKYQSWHKILNVKHFFIFILRFEEK